MRLISSDEIESTLTFPEVIETLRRAYRSATIVPEPARFSIERTGGNASTMTMSPAWTNFALQGHDDRGYIGCSLSIDTADAKSPASSAYLLMSGKHGQPVALLDGIALAGWRHCAQHALAVHYLAREDATRLLVLGSPPRFAQMLEAYRCVRDIRSVLFIGDANETCRNLTASSTFPKTTFACTDDIEGALEGADVICVHGDGLALLGSHDVQSGVHVDLVNTADELPQRLLEAARLFVGDRHDSIASGLEDVAADLRELTQGTKAGRRFYGQVTLFMSGDSNGLPDLATAGHVFLRT
ncbi:ornithine cyclodeaminase [Roseibium sp.]|uniref:ornithine cyclodeaminase n=1 Tax=Roseibium sp. TaxID=1936156 RepID=UPI003A979AEB